MTFFLTVVTAVWVANLLSDFSMAIYLTIRAKREFKREEALRAARLAQVEAHIRSLETELEDEVAAEADGTATSA